MTESEDIPGLALDWHRAGRGAVLATVVETWGSAPRAVGSQLVIDRDGAMQGSVSGGCVEGAVITEAIEALEDGKARLLDFGVSDDEAFRGGVGLWRAHPGDGGCRRRQPAGGGVEALVVARGRGGRWRWSRI